MGHLIRGMFAVLAAMVLMSLLVICGVNLTAVIITLIVASALIAVVKIFKG